MRISPRIGSTLVSTLLLVVAVTQSVTSSVSADTNETSAGGSTAGHQSSITAGGNHTCALLTTGAVKCWGYNTNGQLGDGSVDDKHVPTAVTGLDSGVAAVSAGYLHTCALLTTGAVKCWGNNNYLQIGDNSGGTTMVPVQVSGLESGVTAVSAGAFHTCALLTTGAVKCWGYNTNGQVGDDSDVSRNVPTNVSGLSSGVSAITAGSFHTCALLTTGAVKCWGRNYSGQVGDNSTDQRQTPTSVTGLTSGVTSISAAADHTCAILTSGGVKCWGYNGNGQLGDNTNTDRLVPTAVSGLTSGVTALSSDGNHTCVILTGGAVKCWGYNGYGQLGDNTNTDRLVPTNVSGLTSGVNAVTVGQYHTCAILDGGAVKCWGVNDLGQLGDDTVANKAVPTAVSGMSSGVGPTATTPTTTTSTSQAPTTTVAKAPAPVVRINKSTTAKSIATYSKMNVASTSRLSLKVAVSSVKYCKVSGTSVKGIKTGTCKVTVTVTPKKGKAASKTVSLKVTK